MGCRTKHSTSAHQTNMEEAENGAKQTLAKLVINKDANVRR